MGKGLILQEPSKTFKHFNLGLRLVLGTELWHKPLGTLKTLKNLVRVGTNR